ncbi:MAG: PspC domain-containing protein [Dehalococcoidales bacterium]|jgi:phage shock protein PspC (stress-responsive transcriptional regulator)
MENKLYRSRKDRMLFGVCGGLGKFFGVDSTIIRIVFVLLAFTGFGILAYIVIAIIAPLEESQKSTPQDIIEENAADIKETANKLGNDLRNTFSGKGKDNEDDSLKEQTRRNSALGIVIIIIGVICLLGVFNLFSWVHWWGAIGAAALIGLGIVLIAGVGKKK